MKVKMTRLLPREKRRHVCWYRKGFYATGFLLPYLQLNLSALTQWINRNAAGPAPSCKNKTWFPNRGNIANREFQRLLRFFLLSCPRCWLLPEKHAPRQGPVTREDGLPTHQARRSFRKPEWESGKKIQVKTDKRHLRCIPSRPKTKHMQKISTMFYGKKKSPMPFFLQDHLGYPKMNKQETGVVNASKLILVHNTPLEKYLYHRNCQTSIKKYCCVMVYFAFFFCQKRSSNSSHWKTFFQASPTPTCLALPSGTISYYSNKNRSYLF